MRSARIKDSGTAYYHIISRIIERARRLDDNEKERFCRVMHAVAGFSGIEILTFAVLGNHFHILACIPECGEISDAELLRRLDFIYDKSLVDNISSTLQTYRGEKNDQAADVLKKRYTYRMNDLSEFMKTLKQRISQSYNHRHERHGTLWEGRFRSLLVEGSPGALSTIAAYIDLNSMRAGIINDPKDYRFCGYGEAVAGLEVARRGLGLVMQTLDQSTDWATASAEYRKLLFIFGEQTPGPDGTPLRLGFTSETVQKVLAEGGALTLAQALTCRVRYFTDGVIFGSRNFVEDKFNQHRSFFGPTRTTGARSMKHAFLNLCTARNLRNNPITVPAPS